MSDEIKEVTETKNIKFTQEELDSIKAIQVEYQNKSAQFGQLKIETLLLEQRLHGMHDLESNLKAEFETIQTQEKNLVSALNEKYGAGTLNPQTGEFSPA